MDDKLLQQLLTAVEANEKVQRKFRITVLLRLAKLETMLKGIQAGHLIDSCLRFQLDKEETLKWVQDFEVTVSEESDELGQRMVDFVNGKSESSSSRRGRGRRRSG